MSDCGILDCSVVPEEKKFYFITIQRHEAHCESYMYNHAIDMSPFDYVMNQWQGDRSCTLVHHTEITEAEYDRYIEWHNRDDG